jgi:hypothetical protein
MLNAEEVESLLSKLVEYGFFLQPEEEDRLRENPPSDVDAFTDAIFLAEGINPQHENRRVYRMVRDIVREAFENHYDAYEG